MQGIFRKRIRNNNGDPVGVVKCNAILDTINYELQYLKGFVEEINENHITENILFQVDYGGNHFLLLKDITDHCKYASAINKANGFSTSKSGNMYAKKKTRG